jgi:glycosyltransferase involved in cell wall biosynthesis
VSNTVKESAIKNLGISADRVDVVYRGLAIENFLPEHHEDGAAIKLKEELTLADAYPILINVGRLWPVKGQRDLIQAMPAIKKRFPRAILLIAGQGPLEAELKKERDRLKLQDSVKFLGLRNDIPLLLAVSDIYVATSYLEGFGNALVEAMAAGKPSVAYDIPAWREVLKGEAGVLVETRSPDRLADEITRLASDPEKIKMMGSRGIQIARENFDIRVNTKNLERIYERILNSAKIRERKQ